MTVVWLNGRLTPEAEARISALDRGVIWGDGLFETLRAYDGRPYAVAAHHRRLTEGGRVLDLAVPPEGELRAAFTAILEANGLHDAGVRVTVTRGPGPADPHATPDGVATVLVTAWPLRDYSALYEHGASLVTVPRAGRPVPGAKTISYAANVAGRVAARRAGVDDALFVAEDGRVLETTGSNVLLVSGQDLVTPPVDDGLLPGVTREGVLRCAPSIGLWAVERSASLADVYAADEVVLTSTLREVYRVRSIDGRDLRCAGVAVRLRQAFRRQVLSSL